ncbi:hypothetical protein AN964_09915 [Heyndrickxia shackletonii]|uniref:Uncharacterized protein n=1 Tax=Heyndrickxia shackletonii TaxID=157838 RepID=A0A0Q3TJT4_9BACI|nr:hypothetical protein [Heyndrickxia shackletonii]KQL53785.1 hypothetical protein AN964_09915 [Heyndrickxia shackletonii]NEZ02263.1 hypothetical protein [Heyndrickxia shackletonii]
MRYEELLDVYRKIWNNRLLKDEAKTAKELLNEAITRELLDEVTHPRLRTSKEVKFYYAMKRISDSKQSDSEKVELIKHYIKIMEEL